MHERADLLPVVCALKFDGLPSNPNKQRGQHWSKLYREGQDWKTLAGWKAKAAYRKEPLDKAHLHYHISVGDNRVHDPDNLIASTKPITDGLKGIVIKDDSIDSIKLEFSFGREKPRGITLVIRSR